MEEAILGPPSKPWPWKESFWRNGCITLLSSFLRVVAPVILFVCFLICKWNIFLWNNVEPTIPFQFILASSQIMRKKKIISHLLKKFLKKPKFFKKKFWKWPIRGVFRKINILRGCKSNRKFYRGENRKWHILQGWKALLTLIYNIVFCIIFRINFIEIVKINFYWL